MFLTAFHRLLSDKPEPSWIEPWTAANFCKLRILLNAVPSDLCSKYLPGPERGQHLMTRAEMLEPAS
jgi:hypothetical protein